jgi:hypothetical protein
MKHSTVFKLLFTLFAFFLSQEIFSQDCSVEKESLKGTYNGGCKKGLANGKGKAIGVDVYEGDFKSGLPDGNGTYTWSNGMVFTGQFSKGLREGKGVLKYKRDNATDSLVEGFWKKDIYIGKYEQPYTIFFKSKMITEVEVQYQKDIFNQVTFFITNTSGGAQTTGGYYPRLKVDDVHLTYGAYGRLMVNDQHVKKTESILSDVKFPIRMKVMMGSEEIEVEFREAGSYTLDIHINQ